jgi:hypothetical protein
MIKTPLSYSPGLSITGLENGIVIERGSLLTIAGEELAVVGVFAAVDLIDEQSTFIVRLSDDSFLYYVARQEHSEAVRIPKTKFLAMAELFAIGSAQLNLPTGFVNENHNICFDTALTVQPTPMDQCPTLDDL